jgi:hypothetical protein
MRNSLKKLSLLVFFCMLASFLPAGLFDTTVYAAFETAPAASENDSSEATKAAVQPK